MADIRLQNLCVRLVKFNVHGAIMLCDRGVGPGGNFCTAGSFGTVADNPAGVGERMDESCFDLIGRTACQKCDGGAVCCRRADSAAKSGKSADKYYLADRQRLERASAR